jgi:dolichol-phosphate mannosyltransferase
MSDPTLELSVVMPAYREAENLSLLLPRLRSTLDALVPGRYEVLVVDTTRSRDETALVCRQNGVDWVARAPDGCFGDAIRTGVSLARGERVLFLDADGSHPPEFIPQLYARRDDADVVVASRYVEGGFTENVFALRWMSRILNWTYSVVLGLDCKDVSNSFKLYRGAWLKELRLRCDNFDVVEEILIKIARRHPGARIVEVPFTFKNRMFGETKRSLPLFIASYVWTMLKLRFLPDD